MLRRTVAVLALAVGLSMTPASAFEVDRPLPDPAQELRAKELAKSLRCLVCQNQSIAESAAPLAGDLRRIVRERIAAGDSDRQVLDYMVARYGDWVLLKPPLKRTTYALWFGPVLVFLMAAGAIVLFFRRGRRRAESAPPLSAAEQERLETLLDDGSGR